MSPVLLLGLSHTLGSWRIPTPALLGQRQRRHPYAALPRIWDTPSYFFATRLEVRYNALPDLVVLSTLGGPFLFFRQFWVLAK